MSTLARELLASVDPADIDALPPDTLAVLARKLEPYLTPTPTTAPDGWLDTKRAAAYVGMTVAAFQKHANAREMPFEQDCPGGKRWFQRSDLDTWRRPQNNHTRTERALRVA